MSNYYSTSLGLILQNAGENSTTWGSFVNTNFQTLLEQAIVGQTTVTMANADYTLTSSQGVSNEARNAVLIIGGNNTFNNSVIVPAVPKLYIITNNLLSNGTAYFKVTGSSTSFSVANNTTVMVYCTGSNSGIAFYAVNYVPNATTATTATNLAGGIASQIPYQTGAGATSFIANGSANQVLVSNGTSAPSWSTNILGNATNITASSNSTLTSLSALTTASSLSTIGTVTSGTWQGSVIQPAYIATLNQNTTGTAANITASSNTSLTSLANLNTVGTVTSGTWSGSFGAVSGANLTNITGANVTGTVANATTATTATTANALNTSNAYQGTTFTATTQFSGPGTGLTGTAASLTAGIASVARNITNSGGWSVTPSGTKLYFNYNGTNVGSLDSSGNFIVTGNVTAYGTP